MAVTIGWFPRFSPMGKVTAEQSDLGKYRTQWMGEREIWHNGTNVVIDGVVAGPAGNELTAGEGVWAACIEPTESIWRGDGKTFKGADISYSPDGKQFAYVANWHELIKPLIVNDVVIRTGSVARVRASNTAVTWNENNVEVWGSAHGFRAEKLPFLGFAPIPIETPEGLWVGVYSHTGLIVVPWGSELGYRYDRLDARGDGDTFNPDFRYENNTIKAVFSSGRGVIDYHVFDLAAPRANVNVVVSQPAPQPVPQPVPQPKPEEPKPVLNQEATVRRVRAKYPTPLGTEHWKFLVEVAQATGTKLLRKEAGTNVFVPPLNLRVSQDILMFGDQGVDILGDGEGAATPSWNEKGTIAGEYVDVTGIKLDGSGTVTPPPPPPPTDDSRVRALELKVAVLEAALSAAVSDLNAAVSTMKDSVTALQNAPKPRYKVEGKTEVGAWHQHVVNLEVKEIK